MTISAIARQIWDMKYRLKQPDGTAVDRTVQDSWRRVAAALAAGEADAAGWADRFYRAMEDFRFLPAGRILAGAGAHRSVTLFNRSEEHTSELQSLMRTSYAVFFLQK